MFLGRLGAGLDGKDSEGAVTKAIRSGGYNNRVEPDQRPTVGSTGWPLRLGQAIDVLVPAQEEVFADGGG
jgi:hypothetical protein